MQQNPKLLLRINSQTLVFIINKRTSKSKFAMKLLRPMVLLLMSKNIHVRAVYIPGVNNAIAVQKGWPYEWKTQILSEKTGHFYNSIV
jgi:hypothetical protein